MSKKEKDHLSFPVSGWDIGHDDAHGAILFRPYFLSHPFQSLEEAQVDRLYALSETQARLLIRDIQERLDILEKSGSSIPEHMKH